MTLITPEKNQGLDGKVKKKCREKESFRTGALLTKDSRRRRATGIRKDGKKGRGSKKPTARVHSRLLGLKKLSGGTREWAKPPMRIRRERAGRKSEI